MKTTQILALVFIIAVAHTVGHSQNSKLYMPKEIKQAYQKGTRSWNGLPGKEYWQNSSEYHIDAEFIPDSCKIIGKEIIQYTNNSPDTLKNIVLVNKQDVYKKGGMRSFLPVNEINITDGVKIHSVVINGKSVPLEKPGSTISLATSFYIKLIDSQHILPVSKSTIEIKWELTIPKQFAYRTGKANDSAYFVGYWFPQLAVYDDVFGWSNLIHAATTETYNDISRFDVKLKIPGDYQVWATGELQNPLEIYEPDFYRRLEESKKSGEIVKLISKDDLKMENRLKKNDYHTWNFVADSVPDFSFGIAKNYVWDAKSVVVNKATGRKSWINVVYSPGDSLYTNAIQYAANSVEYFSHQFPAVEYPYSKHTSFHAKYMEGGMEYPMMAVNASFAQLTDLSEVTAHEIAHTYFPFLVNTNEERYAWMDEGWVSLFGKRFNVYEGMEESMMWKRYAKMAWNSADDIPLMLQSNNLSIYSLFHYYYAKPTLVNEYLFEVFEEKGIDNPLKIFMERWEYKHPTPYDYFFTMEDILGEDLGWFWNPWYFEFKSPDLAIEKVQQNNNDIIVKIRNTGRMPTPVHLEITFEDNTQKEFHSSAYVWKENSEEYSVRLETSKKAKTVTLGGTHIIDIYDEDNVWTAK